MRHTPGQLPVPEPQQLAWAAAGLAFGGAAHLLSVAAWVSVAVLAIVGWRIAAAVRGWPVPSLWIRVPVTVAGFLGVAVTYRGVSGAEAGSALLLVMGAMKLLEARNERDRILVVLIGYFLLFALFLREQTIGSAVWLALGAPGITATLAQTVRREALLPAAEAIALATRIALQALPLAALLFVLFPRVPGPFWSIPNARLAGTSGLAEQLSPGDISELSLSDEVAFRVRFDGAVPPPQMLYWRGPVLERFDGRGWSVRRSVPEPRAAAGRARGPAYDYDIVLEPHGQRWLLALETPVHWSAPRATLGPALQLVSADVLWERTAYRARSVTGGVGSTGAEEGALRANLVLPERQNPRTLALARELRSGTHDAAEFLQRALNLFRQRPFTYSLTPPPLGRTHPVDEFLFATREGFCEHYASAFAVLARAGGVPARVVVGYQGGEPNPFGSYWIVRQANAHAWVEVWLDGAWRRLDPTAAVAPERIERGLEQAMSSAPAGAARLWRTNEVLRGVVLSWDAVNAAWDRWVLAFGPEAQEGLLLAFGFRGAEPLRLALLAAGATLLAMLVLGLALRHGARLRPDPATLLYAAMCRRLARRVRARRPAEAAGDYAEAVAEARPDLASEVRAITDLYLRLRYGGAHDPALERELARHVRRFRPGAARAR